MSRVHSTTCEGSHQHEAAGVRRRRVRGGSRADSKAVTPETEAAQADFVTRHRTERYDTVEMTKIRGKRTSSQHSRTGTVKLSMWKHQWVSAKDIINVWRAATPSRGKKIPRIGGERGNTWDWRTVGIDEGHGNRS